MKRIAFLLATLSAALISCQRQEAEVINPADPADQTYHFELFGGETKATLGEEGVFWEAGDQVGLFPGSSTSVAANVNTEASPKTVTYSGSPLAVGTSVYSYYPFQSGNTNVSATEIVFPSEQRGGSMSAMPMAGVPFQVRRGESGTNGVIHFLNLGAVIDFRIYSAKYAGERVRSVMFTATSGDHPVSGEATLNLSAVSVEDKQTLAVSWPSNASFPSSVTLSQSCNVAADKAAAAEGHMYMVVAPGTYSGQITIVTNVATYTFPFTDQTLSINTITRFNMNIGSSKATREAWYVKVNSADEMVDGGKYLIVYESSGPYAFKPIRNNNQLEASSNNRLSVTINNGRIQSTEEVDACQVIFEKANNGYYMKAVAAGGYYFYPTSSNITAGATPTTACSVTNNSGVVNITAGSNNYFKYSSSSNYFKQSTYNNSRELALYLLDEDSQKTQSLQFSASSFTYILDGQTLPVSNISGTPTLSGAQTSVTYSSGNTSVATVDAASGAVTIRGIGETVITATAEENDLFKEGSASYTLKVLAEVVYSLENDKMAAYLDLVEANPYNPPADYDLTYMTSDLYGGNQNQTNRLDWPKPVPISWTTPTSGNSEVYIYNDSDGTNLEFSVSVNSNATSVDVYNLIPGRTYWYVVRTGQTQVASGHFTTSGRRRMLKVAESTYGQGYANNCRDFGGQKTGDGRTIKYGKIFRGSNIDLTSSAAKDFLLNYLKIGLDVDLRTNQSSWGAGLGKGGNLLYDALDLGSDGHTSETFDSWSDLKNSSKMKNILTKIFSAVAREKGVYIHCWVGADRTGYVSLLLEAILGVEQGWCDVDYELTSFSGAVDSGKPRCRTGEPVNHYYRTKNGTVQGVDYLYSLSGGVFGDTFQAKAVNYVVNTLGIPLADVQAFQEAMLE